MLVKQYYGSQSLKLPQIGHLLNHTHGNVTMHVCMYVYTNTDTGSSCFPSIAWANLPAPCSAHPPHGHHHGQGELPGHISVLHPPHADTCSRLLRNVPDGLSSPLFVPPCLMALYCSFLCNLCSLRGRYACVQSRMLECRGPLAGASLLLPLRGFW